MARQRTASFQCPETGVDCVVGYYFGKLHVKPSTSSVHWDYVDEDTRKETTEWCNNHNGKRFKSVEAAADYVRENFGPDGPCACNDILYG